MTAALLPRPYAPGCLTLYPADDRTRQALHPVADDTLARVLVQPTSTVLLEAWVADVDALTGHAVAVRKADCGSGCRCAGEVRLL